VQSLKKEDAVAEEIYEQAGEEEYHVFEED